jgi:hypothetical protein
MEDLYSIKSLAELLRKMETKDVSGMTARQLDDYRESVSAVKGMIATEEAFRRKIAERNAKKLPLELAWK